MIAFGVKFFWECFFGFFAAFPPWERATLLLQHFYQILFGAIAHGGIYGVAVFHEHHHGDAFDFEVKHAEPNR